MPKNWKRGPFGIFKHPFCCKISKKLKGGPFGEKKILEKNVTQCRKTERGDPLGFFNIHSVAKHQKVFPEKNLTMPKKLKGDPLAFFNIHSVAKQQKNWRGDPLGKKIRKKVSQCRKKLKGGTLWCNPASLTSEFWIYVQGQVTVRSY